MSTNYNVFIGPYIQVHNPVRKRKQTIASCTNPSCDDYERETTHKFCPKCGGKVGSLEVSVTKKSEFDVYEEFKDNLYEDSSVSEYMDEMKDYIVLKSNVKNTGGRSFYSDQAIEELTTDVPTTEIEKFTARFTKEIARLKEVFGDASVKIKWGVIASWH